MGPIKVRITDPNQLNVGMIIYNVHAFTEPNKVLMTSIYKFKVVGFPITTTVASLPDFIKLTSYQEYIKVNFNDNTWDVRKSVFKGIHEEEKSMQNMGIIPNTYNKHQTFDNLRDAKQYICSVLGLNITSTGAYDRAMKVLDI